MRFSPSSPRRVLVACLLAPALAASLWATPDSLSVAEKSAGFRTIFDGETLAGWDGNPAFWSVENGELVGRTTKENPTEGNTFIFWRDGFIGDVELRVQWKIEGGNSGIQFRSRDYGDWVCGGYQADIDSSGRYTGILYEERARGILAEVNEKVLRTADGEKKIVGHLSGKDAIKAAVKPGDWNETTIIARGNEIVQRINGVTTMEIVDEEAKKRSRGGVLALQLHVGPPMTVRFRSIRVRNLDPDGFEPLFDGLSLTGWKPHDGLPGELGGKWTVENGTIVGRQHPPGKGGFLRTTKQYKNFELELETKIDWPFDSGIFLRVGPKGKSHQVTLDYRDGGEIGGIYCPWGRGFVQHTPEGIKHFKKDAWNKIKVRIAGEPSRIEVWIGEEKITDFQHTAESTAGLPTEGTVCLQVHPGGKGYDQAFAAFRNLRIRELPASE